jgi:imidazolonepropionase-like amidohydrolase
MENEIGTLEVGKRADITLQSGNATENIYGLLSNKLTMKDGRIVIDKR